jgi:hypothetical protein
LNAELRYLSIPVVEAQFSRDGDVRDFWTECLETPYAQRREGKPFSTCALAFSESWTEAR